LTTSLPLDTTKLSAWAAELSKQVPIMVLVLVIVITSLRTIEGMVSQHEKMLSLTRTELADQAKQTTQANREMLRYLERVTLILERMESKK